jgi:hypothetical protein
MTARSRKIPDLLFQIHKTDLLESGYNLVCGLCLLRNRLGLSKFGKRNDWNMECFILEYFLSRNEHTSALSPTRRSAYLCEGGEPSLRTNDTSLGEYVTNVPRQHFYKYFSVSDRGAGGLSGE